MISPLQTHGSTVTSVTTSLLCIAIRPRASKFGPCTCRGAAAQPPAAGDVAVHGGPVQYDKPQVRSTGRPSAPPVDSDQNQATGCQPARPAHPRMQAGVHHCVVHHCVAGARACPRRKSTRLKLSDSGCTLSPLAPLDASLALWYAQRLCWTLTSLLWLWNAMVRRCSRRRGRGTWSREEVALTSTARLGLEVGPRPTDTDITG